MDHRVRVVSVDGVTGELKLALELPDLDPIAVGGSPNAEDVQGQACEFHASRRCHGGFSSFGGRADATMPDRCDSLGGIGARRRGQRFANGPLPRFWMSRSRAASSDLRLITRTLERALAGGLCDTNTRSTSSRTPCRGRSTDRRSSGGSASSKGAAPAISATRGRSVRRIDEAEALTRARGSGNYVPTAT